MTFIYIAIGIGIFGLLVAAYGAITSNIDAMGCGGLVACAALGFCLIAAFVISDTRDENEAEQKRTECVEQGKIWYSGNGASGKQCLTTEQIQVLKQ